MKRIVLFLCICFAIITKSNAQINAGQVTLGGTVGMQFGNYTMVNISPQIGYNFKKNMNAGVGVSYSYYRDKYNGTTDKSHYGGFNVYGRYYPLGFLVLHAQPEINFMSRTVDYPNGVDEKIEKTVPSLLVGAGLRMGSLVAMLKYDVVQNSYTPYGNRVFYSVGFSF